MDLLSPSRQYRSLETYAGCPHCGGPVNITTETVRAVTDFLTVLDEILPDVAPKDLQEALRWVAAECNEQWLEQLEARFTYGHLAKLREGAAKLKGRSRSGRSRR